MKKTFLFVLSLNIYLFCFGQTNNSQLRIWSLIPNRIDFTTSPPLMTPISPVQSNYSFAHNAIYDPSVTNSEKLLFYVNDGQIIDFNGNNIGVPFSNDLHYNEVSIIPYKNDDGNDEYLVVTPFEYQIVEICDNFTNTTITAKGPYLLPYPHYRGINSYYHSNLIGTSKELILDSLEGAI